MACFSALYFAAFPTSAALRSASFIAPHLAFYVAAPTLGEYLRFLFFAIGVSKMMEVHLSPNRFFHEKLRNVCRPVTLEFNKGAPQIERPVV